MVETLKMGFCSYQAAKYAVEHWHYSKHLQQGKNVKIGIWENDIFIGAITFSSGSSPHLGARYNLKRHEVSELSRIALNIHNTPVTKIIKISISILKKLCPHLLLLISFADANQGHLGKIYQAGNWIYSGVTQEDIIFYAPNGKYYEDRSITESGYVEHFGKYKKCFRPSQCKAIKQKAKYRYLFPLTKEMRKSILKLSKPYPKCVDGVNRSTLGVLPGSGDASATSTLIKHNK